MAQSNSVSQYDIQSAFNRIESAVRLESFNLPPKQVGVNQNQWQIPITSYGSCNPDWQAGIASSPFIGNIDFDKRDWAESRQAVDEVMEWILRDLRRQSPQYKGLQIDSYIRQGSSRDGLKVLKADEFDSMLEFHIEGLEGRVERMSIPSPRVRGKTIPRFCYLQITGTTLEKLRRSCPELFKEGIFQSDAGQIFISSKRLHERVFGSMVDKAIHYLTKTIEDASTICRNAETFRLTRKRNPPAINVTIELKFSGKPAKVIDLDLVPAFRLSLDKTTRYQESLLNCPIHAVCKWIDGEDLNQDLIWSENFTGYEIHILDAAREDQRTLFILTALRIVKTYFVKTSQIAKAGRNPPPQIVTVLKSYHLKQIAFFMIYFICHKYKHFKLYSAEKALSYFIAFLDKALEAKRLPHFFFTSSAARGMLPGLPEQSGSQQRYDLFRRISSEALARAKQSLSENLIPSVGFSGGGGGRDDEVETAIQDFGNAIFGDDYF